MIKKSSNRERIENAALIEFANKGYLNASTNAIAKKAEVAKGSVFMHFGSKQMLYNHLIESTSKALNDTVLSSPLRGENYKQKLLCYAERELDFYIKNKVFMAFLSMAHHDALNRYNSEVATYYNMVFHKTTTLFYSAIGIEEDDFLKAHLTYLIIGIKQHFFLKMKDYNQIDHIKSNFLGQLKAHLSYIKGADCNEK